MTEKVKRLRFPQTPRGPVRGGVPPELDQPSLLGVQFQSELREPLAKLGKEPPRVTLVFEADDEVVRPAHDDHVAAPMAVSPPIDPQVQNVVQVHVSEQRRGRCSLSGTLLRL